MLSKSLIAFGSIVLLLFFMAILQACHDTQNTLSIPTPSKVAFGHSVNSLSAEQYYDKVLGAIVGSAIGDAMGTSTEMWHRSQIQNSYGYITGLTTAKRERSPEGTWGHNLTAGTTTDDTRWKLLMADYIQKNDNNLSPKLFSKHISAYYIGLTEQLSTKAKQSTDELDLHMEKVNWIKEWQRVAQAHLDSPDAYQKSLSRFYGGEMSCAGMLYSPMFGLVSSNPESAYTNAFEHAIFDIGYAKDITAIVAAMTNVAMLTSDIDSILSTIDYVDPLSFRDSRLVSRLALSSAITAAQYVANANKQGLDKLDDLALPKFYPNTKKEWLRQQYIYDQLESSQMPIAFHAGEIWQILFTSLAFGEGDFTRTMQFIVNYGRDNDTVAAVAGMILGASLGFDDLPMELKNIVIEVNKIQLGIDLIEIADNITERG